MLHGERRMRIADGFLVAMTREEREERESSRGFSLEGRRCVLALVLARSFSLEKRFDGYLEDDVESVVRTISD